MAVIHAYIGPDLKLQGFHSNETFRTEEIRVKLPFKVAISDDSGAVEKLSLRNALMSFVLEVKF